MSKIIARRVAESSSSGVFIHLLYLQQKNIKLVDMEFYVTGTILYTLDPANVHFENLFVDTYQMAGGFMFRAGCNYPEAFWTPTFYVKNFTAVVLSDEPESSRSSTIYYAGPGNITMSDINLSDSYSMYGLSTVDIVIDGLCIPTDGVEKHINIDSVLISLPENDEGIKENMVTAFCITPNSRVTTVNMSNIRIEHAYRTPLVYVGALMLTSDFLNLSNILMKDYYSAYSSILIGSGTIIMTNMTFEDAPSHPYGHITVEYSEKVVMDGIMFRNIDGHPHPIGHLVICRNYPIQIGEFKNIVAEKSDLKAQKLLIFSTISPIQSLRFEGITFEDIRYLQHSSLIQIEKSKQLSIESVKLKNVSSSDTIDINSAFISVSQIDLDFEEDIEISNFQYKNSSISLISMLTFTNTPPSPKQITFRDMEFTDCDIISQVSIIRTEGIAYNLDITLTFDNVTFDSIAFRSKGNLLKLDHQLPSNLTISNSRFTNIKQGIINIGSSKMKNTDSLIHVVLRNITVNYVQENDASFLTVRQGGRLFIFNSKFSDMYTYQNGGVLSGSSSSSATVIFNSTFENNYALSGGVFHIQQQSTINLYSCIFARNFAISSGVISVITNAQFKIYDSFVFDNFANANPVSQMLDTFKTSVVSNTTILSNHALSKASLASEFTSCLHLCFVVQDFIDYSTTHFESLISEKNSEYQFQLIFASLSIVSFTQFSNESLIVDSFVSNLEIADSTIKNFKLEGSALKGFSSKIECRNLNIEDLTIIDETAYIIEVLDSTLTI